MFTRTLGTWLLPAVLPATSNRHLWKNSLGMSGVSMLTALFGMHVLFGKYVSSVTIAPFTEIPQYCRKEDPSLYWLYFNTEPNNAAFFIPWRRSGIRGVTCNRTASWVSFQRWLYHHIMSPTPLFTPVATRVWTLSPAGWQLNNNDPHSVFAHFIQKATVGCNIPTLNRLCKMTTLDPLPIWSHWIYTRPLLELT